MKRILKTVTAAILGVAPLAILVVAPVSAAGNILYVGHGTVGSNKNCNSSGYNSVQSAVDAAKTGNTVYLCGGQFAEQVFVNKQIILTGDSTSGLTAPAATAFNTSPSRYPAVFASGGLFLPQALLVTTGKNVVVKGLTISGPLPGNGGCAEQEFGVLALAGSISLQKDQVLNIADASSGLDGCQFGVGIQIGREYWPVANFSTDATPNFSATADITNTTVSGYAKNGITVDGAGSNVNVTGSTVTGFGPTTLVAQNGIQISRAATGNVSNNKISDDQYSGAGDASSGGILVYGGCYGDPIAKNVNVYSNMLVNNDVGIYAVNYNNILNNNDACTGASTSKTNINISSNKISNDSDTNISGYCDTNGNCPGTGYQTGIDDVGNHDNIVFNEISGIGYAVVDSPGIMYSRPIDVKSFPTIAPNVFGNLYDGHPYNG